MDLQRIKELIELLESSKVDEIEIQEGEQRIRVVQHRPQPVYQVLPASEASAAASPADNRPPDLTLKPPASEGSPLTVAAADTGYTVTAPMVGVFYGAPSPTAHPFVGHGQTVNLGDTLCIIEAMKIMNQIDADVSGVVRKVLVESGQPVEFGQPLMIIDRNQ